MASYGVELLEENEEERWNKNVEKSHMGSIFHKYSFLKAIEKHTPSTLYPLIIYKGEESVGLFPLFEINKGPISMVFSPPPEVGVPFIGPMMVNYENLDQKKRESRNKKLVKKSIEYIEHSISPSYYSISCSTGYYDPRPFRWEDFSVTPNYTYLVDLTPSLDDIINSFKKSRRRNIQKNLYGDYNIEIGGKEAIKFIFDQLRARYEVQGKKYKLDLDYFYTLHSKLSSDEFVPYIASIDAEYVSGIIVVKGRNTVNYWQGGGKPDVSLPINDLIHWQIINDFKDKGMEKYDLTGANTPRICKYKSKFNPELVPYYNIKKRTMSMYIIEKIYSKFL